MYLRKWFVFLAVALLIVPALAYAQPMEEEEEPVQARPNPQEYIKTTNQNHRTMGRGQVSAEEEEAQTRPSPFARNSQTMSFMRNAFGSFSGQAVKSLKAGKTVKMTTKRNINARSAGFSAGKGQTVLVSLKRGGICLQRGKNGKKTKGIILKNSAKSNKLLVTSRISNTMLKGSMAINSNGMQLQAKPVKHMR